ncbi:YchJ family protein [Endozoicomonas sp. Mp262]|uniref:YchJ family protein n=1 Tax=Endozoicomonas sp. Mp262 TaxID=2919499 RepID=UPI0021D82ECA
MTEAHITSCPCGSNKAYSACCGLYHSGSPAPTAETLMRSRYSAYALKNIDYIIKTTWRCQQPQLEQDRNHLQQDSTNWLRLEVLGTEAGQPEDHTGIVEFKAWYKDLPASHEQVMHETSEFIRENGQWYYIHPALTRAPAMKERKPERNDPCPCGSGRKYKKCCM